MLKKLENIFIWTAGGIFAIGAVCTVVAYIIGLSLCIKRYVYG